MRRAVNATALLLAASSPVWAQSPEPAPAGTPAGAAALVDSLKTVLGSSPFEHLTLKVEPDDAGYRLLFDPKPFFDAFAQTGLVYEMAPYSATVSQRGDGSWNVFSNSMSNIKGTFTQNGFTQSLDYVFDNPVFKGIFDPTIGSFRTGKGSLDGITFRSDDPTMTLDGSFGPAAYSIKSVPTTDNSVDLTSRQSLASFRETVTVKPTDEMPGGTTVSVTGGEIRLDAAMTSVRMRPLIDLYAFFAANPEFLDPVNGQARLAERQEDLRGRLRAAMPLWHRLGGVYDIAGLSVESPYGSLKASRMALDLGMDGISPSASLDYKVSLSGIEANSAAIPEWVRPLLPQEMSFDFAVRNLDLESPVKMVVDEFDLTKTGDQFEAFGERAGKQFEAHPPTFVIDPSRIKGRDFDLSFSGSILAIANKPAASFTLEAAGLDRTIDVLKTAAATEPQVNQAVGVLSLAKGFGKTLPDGRTQWVIDAASDGSIKINGFQMKPADPVADPMLDGETDPAIPDGEIPPSEAPTDDNALPQTPPQP